MIIIPPFSWFKEGNGYTGSSGTDPEKGALKSFPTKRGSIFWKQRIMWKIPGRTGGILKAAIPSAPLLILKGWKKSKSGLHRKNPPL